MVTMLLTPEVTRHIVVDKVVIFTFPVHVERVDTLYFTCFNEPFKRKTLLFNFLKKVLLHVFSKVLKYKHF